MIILSCGHRVDDEPYYNVFLKSSDEYGNKAVAYMSVCHKCYDDHRLNDEILDNENSIYWLMDKDDEK